MDKKIEENTVRYCLYPKLNGNQELYSAYIDQCLAKLAIYLADYFWYYTSFNLNYISKEYSHSKSKSSKSYFGSISSESIS